MKRLLTTVLAATLVMTLASAAWAMRIRGATNPGNQMGTVQTLLDLGQKRHHVHDFISKCIQTPPC